MNGSCLLSQWVRRPRIAKCLDAAAFCCRVLFVGRSKFYTTLIFIECALYMVGDQSRGFKESDGFFRIHHGTNGNATVDGREPSGGVVLEKYSMPQLTHSGKPAEGRFAEAMKQADQLKQIKHPAAKRWQESNILKTLLAGLRGV